MARALRNGRAVASVEPAPIRCAIYTRKSTEEGLDRDFNSLDNQREAAEAYIRSQRDEGWQTLPDRYDDGGFSGGNTDRPALRQLLTDVEAGKIDCVVVYKYDRLSRSMLDFLQVLRFLQQHNVAFVSVTQQFNTATPVGRMTMNVLASFGEFERDIISERTRDKMHAARRRGKWTGGMVPLGYDVAPEGGRLFTNKEEAEQIRGIFTLFLEKQSLVGTSQELNRRGLHRKSWTTKKGVAREGAEWDRVTLRRVLSDPVYTGKMKLAGEVFPGEHEGIVPKAIFEKVQVALKSNGRDGNSGVRNRSGALLRGLLRCASCDSAMTPAWTRKNDRIYRYYTCSKAMKRGHDTCPTKSVPAAEVEEFVVDRIRAIGRDPDLCRETFRQALSQVAAQRRELKAEAKRVAGEIGKAREEVDRLVGAVSEASNGAREALLAALEKAQQRMTMLENRAAEIQGEVESLKACQVDEEEVAQTLAAFDPIWEVLHTPEKERILGLLIEKVTYNGRTEELTLRFRPTGIATLAGWCRSGDSNPVARRRGGDSMSTSVRTPVAVATYRVKFRKENPRDQSRSPEMPVDHVSRVARLLALAHKIDGMIRSGELKNWTEAARLVGVTKPRMTQIANLMLLTPKIQAAILASSIMRNRDRHTCESRIRRLPTLIAWKAQSHEWARLSHQPCSSPSRSCSSSQASAPSGVPHTSIHSLKLVR